MEFTAEQQKWFRESPHAEQVRNLYAMYLAQPTDPGIAGLLEAAIDEAKRHPTFPNAPSATKDASISRRSRF